MNSSDRGTNEASLNKRKYYTQQFQSRVFERSSYQRLATKGYWEWRLNYCKFCQITARNANKSMLLQYDNSNWHKSLLAKLQYITASTFCDLQMPRYGRKIRLLLCLPAILFKFVFFGESIWNFLKNLIGIPEFGMYSLATG